MIEVTLLVIEEMRTDAVRGDAAAPTSFFSRLVSISDAIFFKRSS